MALAASMIRSATATDRERDTAWDASPRTASRVRALGGLPVAARHTWLRSAAQGRWGSCAGTVGQV
ncbi:hypothetical protein LT493_11755 [Streptomyces tricolor]|nr:hypothetical protein [Streptomyces tricolor]